MRSSNSNSIARVDHFDPALGRGLPVAAAAGDVTTWWERACDDWYWCSEEATFRLLLLLLLPLSIPGASLLLEDVDVDGGGGGGGGWVALLNLTFTKPLANVSGYCAFVVVYKQRDTSTRDNSVPTSPIWRIWCSSSSGSALMSSSSSISLSSSGSFVGMPSFLSRIFSAHSAMPCFGRFRFRCW
uniref:Uncharacterized protein n=1 Tax=Anopheles farauti TaxID=69004 RepID=A0A182QIQ1_9DIPT